LVPDSNSQNRRGRELRQIVSCSAFAEFIDEIGVRPLGPMQFAQYLIQANVCELHSG